MNSDFVHVESHDFVRKIALYVGHYDRERDGACYIQPPALRAPTQPWPRPEPTVALTPEMAQQLIDGLWNLGYRPSNAVSSTGQREAMTAHISDLRTVVDRLFDRVPGGGLAIAKAEGSGGGQ